MELLYHVNFYIIFFLVFITRNYSHGSQGLTPSLPRGVSIVVLLLLGQELSYVWWGFYILRENIQRRLEIVNTIHYYMNTNFSTFGLFSVFGILTRKYIHGSQGLTQYFKCWGK